MKTITLKNVQAYDFKMVPDAPRSDGIIVCQEASDGYHTFDELYDHRIALFIALCRMIDNSNYEKEGTEKFIHVWRSKLHSDGTSFEGWFILGIGKEKGDQITYHLPLSKWEETNFAETLDHAPAWDGHTPADVLKRLKNL